MTDHKHFHKGVRSRDQDPTEVGTSNRHFENRDARERTRHVPDERPRMLGEYDTKPAVGEEIGERRE